VRAEILCVGSELLLGQIIDTNAAYIAGQLARAGVDVHRKQTAGDNLERITDCIRGAIGRADALIITGGLGPTTDDLTREAIAAALEAPLEHRPELEAGLRDFFEQRGMTPSATTMRQAWLPRGAQALPNRNGTAPGVRAATSEGVLIFAMPGVPREMKVMLDEQIIPLLLQRLEGERQIIVSRVLRAFGVGESTLADAVEDILTTSTNPTAAPLIFQNTEVHLRLTAKARDESEAEALLDDLEAQIRARVGRHIFGVNDETLPEIALRALHANGLSLGVAESLTGGLLSSLLTGVPGASQSLRGGVVAYAPEVKQRVLGVPPALIAQHSAVSREVAAAMSQGIARVAGADIGLSTTGEAGPQSATAAPVGTVFIGLCDNRNGAASAGGAQSTLTFARSFHGDRDQIRQRAALTALDLLRRFLEGTLDESAR
jgi:nicotinamide-nucleotide amidase